MQPHFVNINSGRCAAAVVSDISYSRINCRCLFSLFFSLHARSPMLPIDVQPESEELVQEQRVDVVARIGWIVGILLVTPVFSFFLLVYLIVHQIGLVGCDKLGTTTKAVSIVVGIFLMIAWIPGFTLGFYSLAAYEACTMTPQTDAAQELCIQNRINAFAPISAWTVFCIWGTWVAFRHFSIKDSYEPEGERSRVRRLKEMSVDIEVRPGLRGDPSAQPGHITTAFELYTFLKGKMRHIRAASIIAFILCGGTVGIVRGAVVRTDQTVQGLSDSAVVYQQVNFILSTVFFTGMFMVFYATFAFIIVSYLHQVNFVRELTYSMDDQKRSRRIRINAEDIKQLRAWEECRRLAVEELTSSNSILNAMFTPSMWLCALGSILMSGYLVYSKLFQTGNNISFPVTFVLLPWETLLSRLLGTSMRSDVVPYPPTGLGGSFA